MHKIHLVAAARPNFMKIAPLYHALAKEEWCDPVLVHAGQHYDANMSQTFLDELGLPAPHAHLNVRSGTHAEQTARALESYERLLIDDRPERVVVPGDVNSTLACALAAAKLSIPVVHLEAGLRSRDRTMPEELNRILTDSISDLLWTPSEDADANLLGEGVPVSRIRRIGNIMIDALEMLRPRIESTSIRRDIGLQTEEYAVVTLHRPANVDSPGQLSKLVDSLADVARCLRIVFPVHPRTRAQLDNHGLMMKVQEVTHMLPPLGYVDFMGLVFGSRLVITDSGGIQEETSYLGIPCVTLRESTERPITLSLGTNRLGTAQHLSSLVEDILRESRPGHCTIPLWDGKTAQRAIASLREIIFNNQTHDKE